MSELLIPTALAKLRNLVSSETPLDPREGSVILRALQRRGLSKTDLVVHIERSRAQNDVLGASDQYEENALLALDLIEGSNAFGLTWDAADKAAAWVPLTVSRGDFENASHYALSVNDLLPFKLRPVSETTRNRIIHSYWENLTSGTYEPNVADFFRAPKAGLTTRPAALLAPADRLAFEGLVEVVARAVGDALPAHVLWPRGRQEVGSAFAAFNAAPSTWSSEFVLKTDIVSFYESVDHAFLSVILGDQLNVSAGLPVALEALLDAVMGSSVGLPQGPPGSDVLASAFLIDVDRELSRRGWPLSRYADDILIGADTFDEARSRLRALESLLRDRGLTLAAEKTRIMRRGSYLSSLDDGEAAESLKEKVLREVAREIQANDAEDVSAFVEAIDLEEEVQWDLLYHGTVSWEEALSGVADHLLPPWIRAYRRIFTAEARRLTAGGYVQADSLTVAELRRCLVFMSADPTPDDLADLHAIIDWHPSIVRPLSKYLHRLSSVDASAVAQFLKTRLLHGRDSDVEMSWILAPAVENLDLAGLLTVELERVMGSDERPLTAATAFRARDEVQATTSEVRREVLSRFGAALALEVVLSLNWNQEHVGDGPAALGP